MPEYDNRNSGLLFKSTADHPNAPAFSGFWTDENNNQIKIKAYWSKKPDKNGNDFLQISVDTFEKTDRNSDMWPEKQEVPVLGEVEEDGTIKYDDVTNKDLLDNIPF